MRVRSTCLVQSLQIDTEFIRQALALCAASVAQTWSLAALSVMHGITCRSMDGAPFLEWELPTSMNRIRSSYMKVKGGDRDFVELLMLVQEHGIDAVGMACDMAVEQNTLRLAAIINLSLIECCAFDCRPADQPAGRTRY